MRPGTIARATRTSTVVTNTARSDKVDGIVTGPERLVAAKSSIPSGIRRARGRAESSCAADSPAIGFLCGADAPDSLTEHAREMRSDM